MLIEIYCDKFKINGKDGEIRPVLSFHEGLNAIIGDDNRANSIGKSTLLMIIDFVFGGDDYINRCKSVQEHVGPHVVYFTFSFEGEEYSFCRDTIKHNEVMKCDRKYNPIPSEKISIESYRKLLSKYYKVDFDDLSWRGLISKHVRIHNRDTMDFSRPLQEAKDEKISNSIKRFLKQFHKYSTIEEYINKAKSADDERDIFKKSVAFKYINMTRNEKDLLANNKKIELLKRQEEEMTQKSNNGLLQLDDLQLKQVNELNELLISYTRQRAQVLFKLNYFKREREMRKKSFQHSYEELQAFFPGVELKKIEEIELFHQHLSSVLNDEFKNNENTLTATYHMLEKEIEEIKKQISEIKKIPNVNQVILKEYARIMTEINTISSANENYLKYCSLNDKAKQYKEELDNVISSQIYEINNFINNEMQHITSKFFHDNRVMAPVLEIKNLNSYLFDKGCDEGSGAESRGIITFDLANIYKSCVPFIIHDADLLDPIEKPILSNIIHAYDDVKKIKKQVFVSFRSFEFYSSDVHNILKDNKVIQLEANGKELFGWSWNKKDTADISKET